MKKNIIRVLKIFLVFSILLGIIYPLVMTGIGQIAFNKKVNGSIIEVDGVCYGSELLGQRFVEDKHLWGRPVENYDTETFSKGDNHYYFAYPTNISPESEEFENWILERKEYIKNHNLSQTEDIPIELLTQSGSGLDPQISYETALWQIPRLNDEWNKTYTEEQIKGFIDKSTTKTFGFFGKKLVNVLMVNLYLEGILK